MIRQNTSGKIVAAAGLCLLLVAFSATQAQAQEIPEAPGSDEQPGLQVAKEALTLLIDNQNRCQKIAQRYLAKIRGHYASAEDRAQTLHSYVAVEAKHEIAVAANSLAISNRLAAQLDGLAPGTVLSELGTMLAAQENLCRLASRFSTGNAEDFETGLQEHLLEFSQAERNLSNLVSVSSEERRRILRKYLEEMYNVGEGSEHSHSYGLETAPEDPLAQNKMSAEELESKREAYADWQAEQERLERAKVERRQEAEERMAHRTLPKAGMARPLPPAEPKPKPRPTADPEEMKAWHRHYGQRVYPVKSGLSQYLQARGGSRTMELKACRNLSQVTATLLADPKALSAPDRAVAGALKTAFSEFKQGADACILDNVEQVNGHMSAGEKALAQAAEALRPYRLGL